jgi:methionyl-tRNA formyltransferase
LTKSPFFFATETATKSLESSSSSSSNTTNRFFFSTTATSSSSTDNNNNSNSNNNNEKKRIVFLGTPDVAADCLLKIHEASLQQHNSCNFEVVRVVTQPPKRRKRNGSKLEASPVAKVAERLGIPVLCPEKANDDDFLQELQNVVRPHLCITAAYGQYLPKRFLATPTLGTINVHPSLLPRWRGASPVQRSLEAGDNPVGVTLLFTVSKMDAGPIIAQKEQVVNDETDTATTVLPMLFDVGTNLLLDELPDILSGEISMKTGAIQQDESKVVNAAMIQSSEGELKVWQESATTCHNRLRGFSMWPGAFLYLKVGDDDDNSNRIMKVKVIQTRVVPRDENAPLPVEELTDKVVLGPTKKSGLYVVCYDGSILELLVVQPATRKAFAARDFQNGYPGEMIRWVKTPADQLDDPVKYNSRGRS